MNTQIRLIFELARHDLRKQDRGTLLGVFWSFLRPLLFVFTLYLVFTIGLRPSTALPVPFALYVAIGLIPWLYFTEIVGAAPRLIQDYAYTLKIGEFHQLLLPLVKICSLALVHLVVICLGLLLCAANGLLTGVELVQILYYLFALLALVVPLCWMLSATSLFVRDVSNFVTIVVQFGFWLTPIVWLQASVPDRFRWIVDLNPMTYIVSGYRESVVAGLSVETSAGGAAYFWTTVVLLWVIGLEVHRRLRPHFGEVVS